MGLRAKLPKRPYVPRQVGKTRRYGRLFLDEDKRGQVRQVEGPISANLSSVLFFSHQVGIQIACSSGTSSHCKANGRGPVTKEQADGSEATSWLSESPASAAPEVDIAEWDKLEGQDLFGKFSSLLAIRYPL